MSKRVQTTYLAAIAFLSVVCLRASGQTANPGDSPFKDLLVQVQQMQQGCLLFGVGFNSDCGLVGSIALNEQNWNVLQPANQPEKLETRVIPVPDLVVPLEEPICPPPVLPAPSVLPTLPKGELLPPPAPVMAAPPLLQATFAQPAPCCTTPSKECPANAPCCVAPSKECPVQGCCPVPGGVCASSRPGPGARTREDDLIRQIVETIAPQSWSQQGGHGTIEYYPLGMALVVHQTPKVLEEIDELLAALRRTQDQQVVLEIRFIRVPESMERIGIDLNLSIPDATALLSCPGLSQPLICPSPLCTVPQHCGPEPRPFTPVTGLAPSSSHDSNVFFLNDLEVGAVMKAVQCDPHASIMAAPKLTTLNGRKATMNVGERQFFVTALEAKQVGGHTAYIPQNQSVNTGLSVAVQPVISADRRFVQLELDVEEADLAPGKVPLFPIKTFITPVFEGGAVGQPVPFTQYLQQPQINVQHWKRSLTIPNGNTALITGMERKVAPAPKEVPVLSKVPLIGRLFATGYGDPQTEHIAIMVTPRILVSGENNSPAVCENCAPCPPPQPAPPAAYEDNSDAAFFHSVMAEMEKRDSARKVYLRAEHYRRQGDLKTAARLYELVHTLYPQSHYEGLAATRIVEMEAVAMRTHATAAEEQEEPVADKAPLSKLTKLLEKYEKACAENRLADAQKLAVKALKLDPTCFTRSSHSQPKN